MCGWTTTVRHLPDGNGQSIRSGRRPAGVPRAVRAPAVAGCQPRSVERDAGTTVVPQPRVQRLRKVWLEHHCREVVALPRRAGFQELQRRLGQPHDVVEGAVAALAQLGPGDAHLVDEADVVPGVRGEGLYSLDDLLLRPP